MKIFLPFYFLMLIAGTLLVDSFGHLLARGGESGGGFADPPETRANANANANTPAPSAAKTAALGLQQNADPGANHNLPPLPANLKATGNHKAWGLAKARITVSTGELPGGTFLEFPDIDEHPLMAFYFANRNWNGPVSVPGDKVVLFGGTLDGADPADLRLFQRYYYLRGQLEPPVSAGPATAADTPAPAASGNPFEADYKAAVVKYISFTNRTEVLTAERNKASGAARTKIIDDLKTLKLQEPEIIRDLKNSQEKYAEWKKKNPGAAAPAPAAPRPAAPAPALDPARAAEFREELKRLEPEIKRLIQ